MKVISTEKLPIKMWLDDIEPSALEQAKNLANLPFAFKHIAIMPDSHSGYGMPIGGVMATKGVIVPNAVGVDIGCGMIAVKFGNKYELLVNEIKSIMGLIRERVPVGFTHHDAKQDWDGFEQAPAVRIIENELESARKQIGTLGGGNHFIELQKDEEGYIWAMIHSGSRNFGLKVATDYHKKAVFLCEKWYSYLPDKDLAFLPIESDEGHDYYEAMNYCLKFAQANRDKMMNAVINCVSEVIDLGNYTERINIHHNYAAFEHHFGTDVLVHRKGATKARAGLPGIIPGSMGTASYITEGLGNPDSFDSCSHGAGRRMGRKEAIRTLNLEDEQKRMDGIVHGLRTDKELDEAPGAYKDIDVVMKNQKDLTRIVHKLSPLGVIKG